MSRVTDEVWDELKSSFIKENLGGSNLSVIDSQAHACIRRVLGRRGLGGYRYAFVWPVITVTVLPDTLDQRKFVFDVQDLVRPVS